jgi:1-acyl-sn-glycerol-3-phosphate acyltransferase
MKGPLLLASNHPNSFLDATMTDILFDQPVWSLARGDAFRSKRIARILTALKILPVYRTSEGVGNLSENYKTFEACISLFRQGGLVLIFTEGRCVNEWHLRPLKKGTARLAIKSWEEGIPLKVVPVGFNYSSFFRIGKNIFLNFGEVITPGSIDLKGADGLRNQSFNSLLQQQLQQLVFEIKKEDKIKQSELLEIKPSLLTRVVLLIPAAIGFVLNAPLYLPVRNLLYKKAGDSGHYDSLLMGLLLILYPVYLLALTLIAFFISRQWFSFLLLAIIPFTAWSYIRLKPQLDR